MQNNNLTSKKIKKNAKIERLNICYVRKSKKFTKNLPNLNIWSSKKLSIICPLLFRFRLRLRLMPLEIIIVVFESISKMDPSRKQLRHILRLFFGKGENTNQAAENLKDVYTPVKMHSSGFVNFVTIILL